MNISLFQPPFMKAFSICVFFVKSKWLIGCAITLQCLYTYETTEDALLLYYLVKKLKPN